MVKCRHCGSEELRKDNVVKNTQRHKCKHTIKDNVQRYNNAI